METKLSALAQSSWQCLSVLLVSKVSSTFLLIHKHRFVQILHLPATLGEMSVTDLNVVKALVVPLSA